MVHWEARAQYHLRQILVFLDAFVLNKPEVIVPQVAAKIDPASSQLSDSTTRDVIAGQLRSFAAFVGRVSPES